jgi:precorrin-6Y C5,15-methyltransferase (decarboxylating) CbiT subunit
LPESGVFWDIGAGSGAVAIEAARLCPGLDVFAVEKDEEQHALATQNKAAYNVRNLTVLVGEAPDALSALPDPVRVFIGGSGGKLGGIIAVLNGRMHNGIVVVNAATLETLNEAVHYLEKAGFAVSISEISVARSKPVGGRRYLAALNPVFVIMGEKNSGYERMA